jgi:hypothetical protein
MMRLSLGSRIAFSVIMKTLFFYLKNCSTGPRGHRVQQVLDSPISPVLQYSYVSFSLQPPYDQTTSFGGSDTLAASDSITIPDEQDESEATPSVSANAIDDSSDALSTPPTAPLPSCDDSHPETGPQSERDLGDSSGFFHNSRNVDASSGVFSDIRGNQYSGERFSFIISYPLD